MLTPETIRLLLPALIGLPILAAAALLFVRKAPAARALAVVASVAHLVLAVAVVFSAFSTLSARPESRAGANSYRVFAPEFVPGSTEQDPHGTEWTVMPFAEKDGRTSGVQFYIGLDGLNIWLVLLASIMTVPVVLISLDTIRERENTYFAWLFLLQAAVVGVFLSFDILLFYVCFELTLVPLFFLIGGWGPGGMRREAARKLFLFTLTGGLFTLLGIAGVVLFAYQYTGVLTFSIPELSDRIQNYLAAPGTDVGKLRSIQTSLFVLLVIGFAVKIPLVPLHSWLPTAYSEAPIGVTVMLSSLLAKMGTFGLIRVCVPLAPDATLAFGLPVVGTLAAIGIVYGALCAFSMPDFKRLVAYSSLSHLGFCALALMAFNPQGIAGGVLHMVNHGLATGAMFLVVGFLLHRYRSGRIADYSGLWAKLPVLTFFMIFFGMASLGLPGLNNFVSELQMMAALFDLRNTGAAGITLACVAAVGLFLSAWYILTMLRRAFFGPLREPIANDPSGMVTDLTRRELLSVAPLAALCLLLGLFPQPVLDVMKADVAAVTRVADAARERLDARP